MDLGGIPLFSALQNKLGYLSEREKVIAQNVANASTPGFTYLTGSEKNIQSLADTLGFGFKRNFGPGEDKFAHATGIFITTPGGRLSKTLLNAGYTSDEIHAALLDAGDERVKLLQFVDPVPGRTVGLAWRRTSPRKVDFAALGLLVTETLGLDEPAARSLSKSVISQL